jgi:phosphoribosylanthranilate isomerase
MMIKVCGITRREDAEVAVDAGASALGFIFYPKSPRYILPNRARELGDGIAAIKVGIFVHESAASIEEVMRSAKLDVAQIYGGTPPAGARIWKAQRVTTHAPIPVADCEAVLLDGQANGVSFDWTVARGVAERVIIAGGLDASNVAEAIRIAQPWGVDASSKLESSPGIKDHEKVRAFVKAAQAAQAAITREAK